MLLQHSVLSYRIDLYFLKLGSAIEGDEKGHKDRNEYKEVERENVTKEHVDCKFIRINPDEKDFDMYIGIGKIHNQTITLIGHLKNCLKNY